MKSLIIKNFKCISELSIPELATINLITGKNNVGKSTLLEAIAIYASNGSFSTLYKILDDRGEYVRNRLTDIENKEIIQNAIASLFPNAEMVCDESRAIIIGQGGDENETDLLKMQYVYYYDEISITKSGQENRIRKIIRNSADATTLLNTSNELYEGLNISISSSKSNVILPFSERGFRNILVNSTISKYNYQFIKTDAISKDLNANLWDALVMTPKEKQVIKALQIVEPHIKAISFLDEKPKMDRARIPYILLDNDDTRKRLSSMGDGINRVLSIILGMLNCTNGICLIDEFENGLHYTVQTEMWKIIFKLAQELKIQVFATTHSNDCIHSFSEVLNANKKTDGKLIRLENRNGRIVEVSYEAAEVKIGTDNQIEMR